MDTLESMRVFMQVVESGSFTLAAERLNTHPTYVSRAINSLEKHLQTRLLHRTTRRIALTDAGQRYLFRCEQILDYVSEAETEASEAHSTPVGKLRVHGMPGLTNHYLLRAIVDYRELYPQVQFELSLANRIPDLIEEGFDVSIIIAPALSDSSLIARRLASTYCILCASPDYLAKHGEPQTPADLEQFDCLRIDSPVLPLEHWVLTGPDGDETVSVRQTPFQVNASSSIREALRLGMGIGMLPLFTVADDIHRGDLVHVLPAYKATAFHVYARYSSRMFLDAKIQTWVDFLSEKLPQLLAEDEKTLLSSLHKGAN